MTPVPVGFRLVKDRRARLVQDGTVLWGGTPWRLLRLTSAGAAVARALLAGEPIVDRRTGLLARRLLDAGLAHPLPPADAAAPALEVVVPAHDRLVDLDRCLTALAGLDVVVVDDASRDSAGVADLARAHGARVLLRAHNGGPAAARNTGLASTTAEAVAFVDSDCVVSADALRRLACHLADPVVAAVAPRVTDALLDLGAHPANVRPGAHVAYVPTTALLARRSALLGGFDESLRYGEDVDRVWRLLESGWSVRYDPSVVAEHVNVGRSPLMRRFDYGSSVGPLARRHPKALRGPSLAGVVAPMRVGTLVRSGLPPAVAVRVAALAPVRTVAALASWALPASPDAVAYSVGVWRGCLRARTFRPLLPRWR